MIDLKLRLATAIAGLASHSMAHIEMACRDYTDDTYQRYIGTGKRPKSAAQHQREAKRRKNIKKRSK